MSINEGIVKNTYEVCELQVKEEIMRRLEALGINEGTKVTVLNRKRNGSCIIKVRGTRWAIGKQIAQGIMIKE